MPRDLRSERIHRKKLKRLRKRKTLYAYHRVGLDNEDGSESKDSRGTPYRLNPFGFTTRPR